MSVQKNRSIPSQNHVERGRSTHVAPSLLSNAADKSNNEVEARNYGALNISAEYYSRKVFIGGLPLDIDEDSILKTFKKYGSVRVDWPYKFNVRSSPPKGFAFLLFEKEVSVHRLLKACKSKGGKHYTFISSTLVKNKFVEIRPWRNKDADCLLSLYEPLDPRKTVFVGSIPRPYAAKKLAQIMQNTFGDVCYVEINTDQEFKYPKLSAKVFFNSQKTYMKAISTRFVKINDGKTNKTLQIEPYVFKDQACDICRGKNCNGKVAQFFCPNITCLKYYCDRCWTFAHAADNKKFHTRKLREIRDFNKTPLLKQ